MKPITQEQINNVTHELSSAIETQTNIVVSNVDLNNLNRTVTAFFLDHLDAEIIEEEEEFVAGNFLLLRPGGYPYGVVAFPKSDTLGNELHGPFDSEQNAREYIFRLRAEYEDYTRFSVCRIELPSVGNVIPSMSP